MSRISRQFLTLTAVAAAATSTLAPIAAHAGTARNGICETGELCYSYNSGFTGSISDFTTSVPDLGATEPSCYDFKSTGTGHGICVKNHAAAVRNLTGKSVTIYVNSGYQGATQIIPNGATVNLNPTLKNNEAGHQIGTTTTPTTGGAATVVARAQSWVNAHVPYNMGGYYHGYREDCSGYVSMAWGLPAPGRTTDDMLGKVGNTISKAALRQGDALLNPASGAHGHIVLFDKWADSGHNSYWGYEESGSRGAVYRQIPYPYFSGYDTTDYAPFRVNHVN